MRKITTRALVSALVLLASATAASAEAPAKAAKRHHCGRTHVCRHQRPKKHPIPLPPDYAAWTRTADCESGGWVILGSSYPDSLGIDYTNYVAFGGRPLPPGRATRAEIVAQIEVADRLIAHYGMSVPDQAGCAAW